VLFCKGCFQIREGTGWKHVPGMCRVGRDQEFAEMNVSLPCCAWLPLLPSLCVTDSLKWTNNTLFIFLFLFCCFMIFLRRSAAYLGTNVNLIFLCCFIHRTLLTVNTEHCLFSFCCYFGVLMFLRCGSWVRHLDNDVGRKVFGRPDVWMTLTEVFR